MLLVDDIPGRLQRLVARARRVIVVFTCVITPLSASAQIVLLDTKRWTEKDCRWLHKHVLDECSGGLLNAGFGNRMFFASRQHGAALGSEMRNGRLLCHLTLLKRRD